VRNAFTESFFELTAMKSPTQYESPEDGFTRLDLFVALIVLVLLALMLLPALARTKTDSRASQCLSNNRELNRAWRMWTDDNGDLLLYATWSSPTATNRVWVTGTLDFNLQNGSNWDPQATIMKSPMWAYCGTNARLWRCPSDTSAVTVNGVNIARIRSYAMNLYLGGFSGSDGGFGAAVSNYRLYLKGSDLDNPSPAQIFVFTDMRPETIAGGEMFTWMDGFSPRNPASYGFLQFPSAYHDGAAAFSFADGRGELHRWQDRRTTPPFLGQQGGIVASPRNPDIAWLQDHATRPK